MTQVVAQLVGALLAELLKRPELTEPLHKLIASILDAAERGELDHRRIERAAIAVSARQASDALVRELLKPR